MFERETTHTTRTELSAVKIGLLQLNFSQCAWVPHKKLQRVMNVSVRFIYDVKQRELITEYLIRAHFLPVMSISIQSPSRVCSKINPTIEDLVTFPTPSLRSNRDELILDIPIDDRISENNFS
jgi:hypothetical protein